MRKIRLRPKNNKGFTIIELLIASGVFSFFLLILLFSFIQISRMFYKGVNMSNTQEATRTIVSSLTDDIRFAQSNPSTIQSSAANANIKYFCVADHRYRFILGNQIGYTNTNPYNINSNFGFVRENVTGGCLDPGTTGAGGISPQEILDNGMQLNWLSVGCNEARCFISTHVVFYSERDMLLPNYTDASAECSGALAGSQYCATASYSATVLKSI